MSPYLASPLVSPQWLADHLGSDGLVVVDATVRGGAGPGGSSAGGSGAGGSGVGGSGLAGVVSIGRGPVWLSGRDAHLTGDRIPGALFADLLDGFSNPDGAHVFSRPDAERFQASVRALGIDAESTVIVYDGAAGQWAARLWWLFRSFGHERVAVLDGGLGAWRDEERPVESGPLRASVEPVLAAATSSVGDDLSDEDEGDEFAPFVAVEQPGYWVDKAHVQSVVTGSRSALLLCALSGSDFRGETGLQARPGHIPGSLNVPATGLFDRDRARWLKPAALRERFGRVLDALAPPVGSRRAAAPAESPRVITYCNQGIAASATAFALAVIGETDVAVYDGSLEEWSADLHAPLVTSAA